MVAASTHTHREGGYWMCEGLDEGGGGAGQREVKY